MIIRFVFIIKEYRIKMDFPRDNELFHGIESDFTKIDGQKPQ
jgi:hypothetical protein